jgi:hypothetical protein
MRIKTEEENAQVDPSAGTLSTSGKGITPKLHVSGTNVNIESVAPAFWRLLRFDFKDGRTVSFPTTEMRKLECDHDAILTLTFYTDLITMRGRNIRQLYDKLWQLEIGRIAELSEAEAAFVKPDDIVVTHMEMKSNARK